MSRRAPPFILIALAVAVLLGWYVLYTRQVVSELRRAAQVQVRMSTEILNAIADTNSTEGTRIETLLTLTRQLQETGVPQVLTDPRGAVADTFNLPFTAAWDSKQMRQYVRELDAVNPPIVAPGGSAIHFGDTPLVRGLSTIPLLQAAGLGFLLLIGLWGLRERGRAEREKVWAGMARESAHQLGTPLSSLAGWLELLEENEAQSPTMTRAIEQMKMDMRRLDRVAHRFERIGRPPRKDEVELGDMVERIGTYFAARVPKLARKVTVTYERPDEPLQVAGDGVLLEWVLEVLVKNAIDALGGRGGEVVISATPLGEGRARLRVTDNGLGVPRNLRKKIFEAGYSTKERGWGIGLSLAKRIVEENHGGELCLVDTNQGATFDVILQG